MVMERSVFVGWSVKGSIALVWASPTDCLRRWGQGVSPMRWFLVCLAGTPYSVLEPI